MTIHFNTVRPASPAIGQRPAEPIPMATTFQGFLQGTLNNQIDWNRRSSKSSNGLMTLEELHARNDGVNLYFKGSRPLAERGQIPTQLFGWEMTLEKGRQKRGLSGSSLPVVVSPDQPLSGNSLSRLVGAGFKAASERFEVWAAWLGEMADKVQRRAIPSAYTFMPASLTLSPIGSASVLQFGNRTNGVEITKFSGTQQIMFRKNGKATRLPPDALENPVLFAALNRLVLFGNEQNGRPGIGLDRY